MGRHHGNSLTTTVQSLYVEEYVEELVNEREPFTWPESPTSHRKPQRQRVAMGGPPVDRPQCRIKRGLVVGMFSLLLGACVPVDAESVPHDPPAAPTTGPPPTPAAVSVERHQLAPFVAELLDIRGGSAL